MYINKLTKFLNDHWVCLASTETLVIVFKYCRKKMIQKQRMIIGLIVVEVN